MLGDEKWAAEEMRKFIISLSEEEYKELLEEGVIKEHTAEDVRKELGL